jgi:hypothetical protein
MMSALTYGAAGMTALRPAMDQDVWWHLRTAAWIVEHRAVPFTDPFSLDGASRPWVAYSWLFELMLFGLYRAFGLIGVVVYAALGALAVTGALQALVSKFETNAPRAVAFTVLGVAAMAPLFWPRSYLLSIILFIVELYVLFAVRASGRVRPLLVLPPLFVVWANVHIQFVYGLFALAAAAVEPMLHRWLPESWVGPRTRLTPRPLVLTFCASVMMCLVTPYHIWITRPLARTDPARTGFDIDSRRDNSGSPSDWPL